MAPATGGDDESRHRKRSRRDEKLGGRDPPEAEEVRRPGDRDRRHRRREEDGSAALSLDKAGDGERKDRDRRADGPAVADGDRSAKLESAGASRSRSSYYQYDERNGAARGDRGSSRRTTEHGRWLNDTREHSRIKGGDKDPESDSQKKAEKVKTVAREDDVWKHDGYHEMQAEGPLARKRPAFKEKKSQVEEPPAAAAVTEADSARPPHHERPGFSSVRREGARGYNPSGTDRFEKTFPWAGDRDSRRTEAANHKAEIMRHGHQPGDRNNSGSGVRGRDRYNGRYNGRNSYRSGDFQVEKWKHDLFDESNKSPSPKNDEDQIAKVEALLAS